MKKFKFLKNIILGLLVFSFVFNAIHFESFAKNEPIVSSVRSSKDIKGTNSFILDSNGKSGMILNLFGTDLDNKEITVKVVLNGIQQPQIEATLNTNTPDVYNKANRRRVTIDFPKNDSKDDKVYELEFALAGITAPDNVQVKVTVKGNVNAGGETPSPEPHPGGTGGAETPAQPATGMITKAFFEGYSEEKSLDYTAGDVQITLMTKNVSDNSKIKAQLVLNGEKSLLKLSNVEGLKNKKTFSINIPENPTSAERVYTIKFNVTGSETEFSDDNTLIIKVKGKEGGTEVLKGKIDSFKANKPVLDNKGGVTSVTVKGSELESKNLKLKFYKVENGKDVETNDVKISIPFDGRDNLMSARLEFLPVTEKTIYKVKVGIGDNFTHETLVTVGGEKSNETAEIRADKVYSNDSKTIIMVFHGKMTPVKDMENLKSLIFIAEDGSNFVKLSEKDIVEINDNIITIKLDKKIKISANTKVRFAERAITNEQKTDNKVFDSFIKTNVSLITDADFVEGEILESKGGAVKIKLVGENLNAKIIEKGLEQEVIKEKYNIDAKVVKNQKLAGKSGIEVKIDRSSDTEYYISFNLPENKTTNTESYVVQVSTDGGKTYSSEVGAVLNHRTKKLVSAVLAEGVRKDEPTLSFMTIQSYGTFVADENKKDPDMTHTDAPIGQESKKTWVNVYGTNLKKEVTKVKIVDEFGIEWTPIQGSASDSMDQFIMIGFDHTGIDGNGNNQSLEVICPRDILVQKDGDEKPRSATYKYLVAVDGKNFNQEIFVTATITDDKKPGKHIMSKDSIKEVKINYVDESGNPIIESKIKKGHTFGKAIAFNMVPEEIGGFEVVKYSIKGKSENGATEESFEKVDKLLKQLDEVYLGKYMDHNGMIVNSKLDEITYVYKKTVEIPDNDPKEGLPEGNIDIPNKDNNTGSVTEKIKFIENKEKTVKVESDNLRSGIELKVEKVKSLKGFDSEAFDIYFVENGKRVELGNGIYKVTVQKNEGKDVKAVYHIDKNGKLTSKNFTQNEKTVTFTTEHFSVYAVVYNEKADEKTVNEKTPKVTDDTRDEGKNVKSNSDKTTKDKKVVKKSKLAKTSISGASALLPLALLGAMTVINKKRNK